MAKLTARFDMEDRISKKLGQIRNEAERLERSRERLNKPLLLRVDDRATPVMRRVKQYADRQFARAYMIGLGVRDRITKPIHAITRYLTHRFPKTHEVIIRARDRATSMLHKINRYMAGNILGARMLTIMARDSATPVIRRIATYARTTLGRGYHFSIRAIDNVTRTAGRIGNHINSQIPRTINTTVRVFDMATRPLRAIVSAMTSTLGVLGVAGGIGGGIIVPIKLVAERENLHTQFETMLGSTSLADERMEELTAFAGRTPLTRDEIFRSSRVLQTFTGDALARPEGMEIIGDVAVGTGSTLEETAMWFGRLYDGIQSGRPIGMATNRLQEMGAIGGEARQRIEDLAESGGDIATVWPKVTKEFSKYNGMMEKMSHNMSNLLLGLKSFVGNAILIPWGEGISGALKPALLAFREWRGQYSFVLQDMSRHLKIWGEGLADSILKPTGGALGFLGDQLKILFPGFIDQDMQLRMNEDSEFKSRIEELNEYRSMPFSVRWEMVKSSFNEELASWWDSTGQQGAEQLGLNIGNAYGGFIRSALLTVLGAETEETGNMFIDAGVTSGKNFITGFIEAIDPMDLSKRIGSKLLEVNVGGFKSLWGKVTGNEELESQGSIAGALFANALAAMLISTVIAKVTPLGKVLKGMFDIGKNTIGKLIPRRNPIPTAPVQPTPTQPIPTGKKETSMLGKLGNSISKLGKFSKGLPFIAPVLGAIGLATAEKDEIGGSVGGLAGGVAGATTGAMIGSAIPVIGTAIGGLIGGIVGSIGGDAIGSWIQTNWDSVVDLKDTIVDTLFNGSWWSGHWDSVKGWASEKLSDAGDWFMPILQSAKDTIFSSDFWLEQAGFIFGYLEGTLFNGEWWGAKWGSVVDWTSQKWEMVAPIFENVIGAIAMTLFNGEWWLGHWDNVTGWASEKWESAREIWTTVSNTIAETLFSGEWWLGKWESVKGWTSEKWDSAQVIWTSVQTKMGETIFNGEWWLGKWDGVLAWTQGKWNSAVTIWESVKSSIASSLFSADWWLGKWDAVVGWGKTKLGELKSFASGLMESVTTPFQAGRERGNKATAYANGGIINQPHLGLVGEAGPEAIIPLSANRRGRALDLYEQVGRSIGVKPYADGGVVGQLDQGYASVVSASSGGGSTTVKKGDIVIQFNGDNYFSDEMDAEKVGNIAIEAINEYLNDGLNSEGEGVYENI